MANPRNLANIAPSINASSGNVQIGSSLNNVDSSTNVFQAVGSTATGNAFIGTSSAFSSGNGGGQLRLGKVDSGVLNAFGAIEGSPSDPTSGVNGYLAFKTSDASKVLQERGRITSGGDFYYNTTAGTEVRGLSSGAYGFRVLKDSYWEYAGSNSAYMIVNNTTTTGTRSLIVFRTTGTDRGSITSDGSTVAYNTSSDYRLKENIIDLPNSLSTVAQLKPRQFDWKETGNTTTGFIAHELAEVFPQAVSGEKDAIETYLDNEGNEQTRPKYQGIDVSFLVATLTAAIQEQQTIIESLKARLDAANL